MSEQQQSAPLFAVVELFGHARIAGAVTEQTFGGATLVRVDVPEIRYTDVDYDAPRDAEGHYQRRERVIQPHTRSFGPGAIYAISWCDEVTAKAAAASIRHEPLAPYSAAALKGSIEQSRVALPAPVRTSDDGDDDIPY